MINAFGAIYGRASFSIHARHFFRALHRRHPVAWFFGNRASKAVSADLAEMLANAAGGLADGPSIGIDDIASVPTIRGQRRIALVVWEPSLLPPEKRQALDSATELWTPTNWGRELLIANGFDSSRVSVVPEGVDVRHFVPSPRHGDSRPFRFLCVARWTPRKGVADVIETYCREFRSDEPVELVLHCGERTHTEVAQLLRRSGVEAHAPIVASPPCSESELVAVYNRCDALVLASKSEGWGLPVVEAMACGLPGIATNYGALAELVHDSVGYPVRVAKLIAIDDPFRFPGPGPYGQWAQPDLGHLGAIMRHVFEHPGEARQKGQRAREEVVARWTWEHAAAKACKVLQIS